MPQLTEIQHETLAAALEMGYFEQPRKAHQADLAQHFGVSEQAVSQRLARAHKTLAEQAVEA